MMVSRLFGVALLAVVTAVVSHAQAPARNVILITIDGLRWQEFFTGADRDYFKRDKAGSGGEPGSGSSARRPRSGVRC